MPHTSSVDSDPEVLTWLGRTGQAEGFSSATGDALPGSFVALREPRSDALRTSGRFGPLVGASPPMRTLYDQLGRVASSSATVLLVGQSGTGKRLAAQTLHELSGRKDAPCLVVDCAAIPSHLIEGELFGHEKSSSAGAVRQDKGYFERANGGTLVLDEIAEISSDLQTKLLRVLETGSFLRGGVSERIVTDVRVIAATSRSPEKAVADGRLRKDLFNRLSVFPIRLPSLRERSGDLELLAHHFLDQLNKDEATHKRLSSEFVAHLYSHSWPGNVRELRNYVHRAFILADEIVGPLHLQERPIAIDHPPVLTVRVGTPLYEIERRLTMATLAQCGNVKRRAAEILGISAKTLYNRLEHYAASDKGAQNAPTAGQMEKSPR
jgi:DNA-binding NtrC family response regulator